MPVLIDGNNLLYAARDAEKSDRLVGRSMLCDLLGRWVERYPDSVHVIFDGPAPPAGLAAQIGHPAIRVSYSGAGVSADAVLIDILASDSAARRLTVVSSDRAIVRAAKARRSKTLTSAAFWAQVTQDLKRSPRSSPEPEEKEAGLSPDATDDWLREFGLD